jgi:hypothetical protein
MAQMLYPTFVNSRFYQHLSKTSAIRLAPTAHNSGKLFRDYSLQSGCQQIDLRFLRAIEDAPQLHASRRW